MMSKDKERSMKKSVIDKMRQNGMPGKKKSKEEDEEASQSNDLFPLEEDAFVNSERKEELKKKGPSLSPDAVKKFGSPFRKK
jgi:hypothetical protein